MPDEAALIDTDATQGEAGQPSEPRVMTTREGRVAWIEAGANSEVDPRTPPLVLIHGFTGHRDDFLSVLAPLARRRRVLVPDLRGHGDSEAGPGSLEWTFEQFVKDLLAFLDALEIPRIDLLGHSMGGFVAQHFVLANPGRVRSLCLLCTGPELPASLPRSGFEKAAAIAEARGIGGLQAIFERGGRIEPSPTLAAWQEGYWIHHRRRLRAMSPASYAGIGSAFFASKSLVSRLAEVTQPSLIMVGEFDRDWLPGAESFLQTLPAARRVTISNAEHHPHRENPREFLAALEDHLKGLVEAADDAHDS